MKNGITKVVMLLLGKVVYWPLYLYSVLMCRYFGTTLDSIVEDNSRFKTEHVRVGNKYVARLTDKWGRHKFVFFNDEDRASHLFRSVHYGLLLSYNEFSGEVESELVVYHIHLGIIRYTGRNKPCFLNSLERLEALF